MRPLNQRAARRRAAVLAIAAGVALLTACGNGSSSSSTAGQSKAYQQALAYTHCLRAHGIPNAPDPNSSGGFIQTGPGGPPGVSPAQLQAANSQCQHLLPNGGVISQQQQQQAASGLLAFSKCMRSHGFPTFPDPPSNGELSIKGSGINTQSPQFQSAQRECQSLVPPPSGAAP